jgi:hypothetical protein
MIWEYTTLQIVASGFEDSATNDTYNGIINQYGADGWELVSTEKYLSPMAGGEVIVLFFKRPSSARPG